MTRAERLKILERRINALRPLRWSREPGERVALRFGEDMPAVIVPKCVVTFLVTGQDMSHTAHHARSKHSTHGNNNGHGNKLRGE